MKLIYTLTLTLGLATSAFAAQKQVNSDMLIAGETAYAQLCMAAMESKQAVNKKARETGHQPAEARQGCLQRYVADRVCC